MQIAKEIRTYCPYCNKHTLHKVRMYSKGAPRGLSMGTRRHNRKIKGYSGSVSIRLHPKKLGKRQKIMLECAECKKSVERVIGGRTKKKIEIKK